MSLHNLASQVQAQGRNGDSMLVHMTPGEVGGLQALAQRHGGSLTINPATGLPEANFLKSILPTLLGVGLSFVPGVGPLAAGALVGGGTALATGDIQQGLLSGLGAAGGAGLAGGLTSAGAKSLGAAADTANFANLGMSAPAVQPATAAQSFGEGIRQAAGAPGQFLKSNIGNIGMAAAPMLAGGFGQQQAPGTPEAEGMIRPYDYEQEVNPDFGLAGQPYFRQRFTPRQPVPAAGFTGFADGGIAQLQQPYTQPQTQVDPAVAAYNQQLMQRAQAEYNQAPQLAAFRSALPNQGVYDPQAGEAFRAMQQRQAEQAAEIKPNQFGFQFDPTQNRVIKAEPSEDQFQKLQQQMQEQQQRLAALQGQYDSRYNQYSGGYAAGGIASLGSYSDGGQLLRGPGDGVSDNIPATIEGTQPARLADGEFVVPARIVSELGNGSTEAGARKLYAMMDRVQKNRANTVGKDRVAVNTRSDKELPA